MYFQNYFANRSVKLEGFTSHLQHLCRCCSSYTTLVFGSSLYMLIQHGRSCRKLHISSCTMFSLEFVLLQYRVYLYNQDSDSTSPFFPTNDYEIIKNAWFKVCTLYKYKLRLYRLCMEKIESCRNCFISLLKETAFKFFIPSYVSF